MMSSFNRKAPSQYVPYGLIVTKKWLLAQGISLHTLDNWLKSNQIRLIAPGVYTHPDTQKITWQRVLYSLQNMGSDLCIGGLTALSLQGFGHYSELGNKPSIHIYGQDKLPSWVKNTHVARFIHHNCEQLFNGNVSMAITTFPWGMEEWQLVVSTPEKAWFEILWDVPETVSFEYAEQLLQGLVNFSPKKLNLLMEHCSNIKVRRLFLWFAERQKHPWFKKIDIEKYTMESGLLGSGKRSLLKHGKLNKKYMITVPKEMYE